MILIPINKREEELRKYGIPEPFLMNIGKIEELEFRIEGIENSYFYLPTLSEYKILKNKVIIPIYDSGTKFWILQKNEKENKIIFFELEQDEIYIDYGMNWELLLLDIMIQYFDDKLDAEISMEKFVEIGEKIGFKKTKELFDLRNLEVKEYNLKFQDNVSWRIEIAQKLDVISK